MTQICVSKLTIIDSENDRCQAIICTIIGILLFGPLGTKFNEFHIKIQTFSLKKTEFKCRLENGGLNLILT